MWIAPVRPCRWKRNKCQIMPRIATPVGPHEELTPVACVAAGVKACAVDGVDLEPGSGPYPAGTVAALGASPTPPRACAFPACLQLPYRSSAASPGAASARPARASVPANARPPVQLFAGKCLTPIPQRVRRGPGPMRLVTSPAQQKTAPRMPGRGSPEAIGTAAT